MSRHARRIDSNQRDVVACLEALGATVHSTAALGNGFPDLLVLHRGVLRLVEVKDGRKPPSARKLTPAEVAFARRFPVFLVECPEDAAEMLRGMLDPIRRTKESVPPLTIEHGFGYAAYSLPKRGAK